MSSAIRMVDPAAVYAAIFDRLSIESPGEALRAKLAQYQSSVASIVRPGVLRDPIARAKLARPILALKLDPILQDAAIWKVRFTWWMYDDIPQGGYRLRTLVKPLVDSYPNGSRATLPFVANGAAIGYVALDNVSVGDDEDPALDMTFGTCSLIFDC